MKRKSSFTLITMLIALLTFGFVYGYYSFNKNWMFKPRENEKKIDITEEKEEIEYKNEDIKIDNESEYIGPNTMIEYNIHYKKCNDYIKNVEYAEKEIINMNQEQFENHLESKLIDWKISYFSNERVTVEIEKDQICPKHFIIGIKDDRIAIYKINDDGEKVLYQIIDVPISLLKEVDQKKLEKGIIVDSEEEIGNIIENFIS